MQLAEESIAPPFSVAAIFPKNDTKEFPVNTMLELKSKYAPPPLFAVLLFANMTLDCSLITLTHFAKSIAPPLIA